MASGSKKGTQIYFPLSQKSQQTNPSGFPNRTPVEREARLQGILHISQKPHLSGSPVKKPSLKVPFMESLTGDAPPLEPSLIHLSKSLVYEATLPHTRFHLDGKGSPWREMPVSRVFLNISSRVPSEGAPPRSPAWNL